MRFDSVQALIKFLGVLVDQGYSIPFCDYDKELKSHGFIKHIHFYQVLVETVDRNSIKITFFNGDNVYVIIAERRQNDAD